MTLSWDKTVEELSIAVPVRHRWTHIWGVVETAMALAEGHGVNLEKTARTALLHDCAKCLDPGRLEVIVRDENLAEEEDDLRNPPVWHALVGAYLARRQYGVKDEQILRAIRHHPTGSPDMDELGMVLFIADYSEPTRRYVGSREFRRRALERPLAETAAEVCRNKIEHVRRKGRTVHHRSLRAVEALEKRVRQSAGGESGR